MQIVEICATNARGKDFYTRLSGDWRTQFPLDNMKNLRPAPLSGKHTFIFNRNLLLKILKLIALMGLSGHVMCVTDTNRKR
jgi:hypothetical protein